MSDDDRPTLEVGDVVRAVLYYAMMTGCVWFLLWTAGGYYWFPWQWWWWPW